MAYVITKRPRLPRKESYAGSTWDVAGIRFLYKKEYVYIQDAVFLACILSQYNPVGFEVDDTQDLK